MAVEAEEEAVEVEEVEGGCGAVGPPEDGPCEGASSLRFRSKSIFFALSWIAVVHPGTCEVCAERSVWCDEL